MGIVVQLLRLTIQLGVYKRIAKADGSEVLVKLAYRGAPSRAEFPLTEAFAKQSNNSRVGLSGEARVIQDVASYVSGGGEYYSCDGNVASEACLPLYGEDGFVCGIIDVEAFASGFFVGETLEDTLALALVAQDLLRAWEKSW